MKPIDENIFNEQVKIKFKNILDGFNNYNNNLLESDFDELFEECFINFLKEAFEMNGSENCFVDFHYNILNENDKRSFKELLIEEDKEFISKFEERNINSGIYFRLTYDSIPFIARVNSKEILFSTIFFTKFPMTIWGNYNKKFPIFYEESICLEKYKKICEKYKLKVI